MLAERQMNSHQNSPRRAYNLYYANGNIRGRFEWRLNRSSSTTIIVVGGQRRIRSGSTRAECYQAFSSSSFISLFSLAFSASCPHPLSLSLFLSLLRLSYLQDWQTNILRGLRACNYPVNASDFQVPREPRARYALDWLRNLPCHWGACWCCPPGVSYSSNFAPFRQRVLPRAA